MSVVTVALLDITAVTPRSRLLTLDLAGQPFRFQPGQAVMVGASGLRERRPYSIACSPERAAETGLLELLIAVEPDGALSGNLGAAARGTLLEVEGPIGTFTMPDAVPAGRVLFVAGGAGIAPLRSMLDHLLRGHGGQQMSLLYSARRSDEFAFIDELRAYSEAGRLELHQTVTRDDSISWTGRRGRIGRDHFEAVLHEADATICFVCGPASLVNESVATLKALGVPEHHIRTEEWER